MSARPESELPVPGDVLVGRYRLEAVIGQGGFGAVYVAHDSTLEREVAIKVLRPSGDDDDRALVRFLREAKATAALDCEHLTTIYEVGVVPGGPAFIVMERLHGRDLFQESARRGRLPLSEAVDVVLEVSLGLAHAHAAGIVHRDLKPRNIFLAQRLDGTRIVKVLDFGIAKSSAAPESLTETGTMLGTPRYMAPEQVRCVRDIDARADLWALGVVLYELTTGSPIFDADGSAAYAAHILVEPPVPLRRRVPELPAAFEVVVHACLEKEPARRIPDLAALAAALAPFATDARRALVPRIARALAASRSASASQSEAVGLAPTRIDEAGAGQGETSAASAPTASVSRSASGPLLANVELAAGTPPVMLPPVPSPSRAPMKMGALALVGLGMAGAVGWYAGHETPTPIVTVAGSVASPDDDGEASPRPLASALPSAVATAASAASTTVASAPAPSAHGASATSAPRPSVGGPTAREQEQILEACDSRAPVFLVPANDGPARMQYQRLANLGCAGIRQRCGSVPIAEAERARCRVFLGDLKSRGICP